MATSSDIVPIECRLGDTVPSRHSNTHRVWTGHHCSNNEIAGYLWITAAVDPSPRAPFHYVGWLCYRSSSAVVNSISSEQ